MYPPIYNADRSPINREVASPLLTSTHKESWVN
jgi:hypothetical protein